MSATATINCNEYEYVAEPTEGVRLSDGHAWRGVYVKYRKIGARKWQRFHIVDVHSWDTEAIVAAIAFQETPA